MTYKAIFFDLGKVLVAFDFGRGYRAMEALCPHPTAEIRRRLAATDLVLRLETGRIEPREFVSQVAAILEMRAGYDQFCEIWGSIFEDILVPESMVKGLAGRYCLVLVSNTNSMHFELLRRNYPLLQHFHHLVLSHEVGAAKPDPRIYEVALERAGCRPEECFYTDDIPEFVAAARALGIDAVQFESAAQIESELHHRGITW